MMEETFKKDCVPGCIKTACIDERYTRSRLERADIFLQFVLTNEKLLMAFRRIYEKSSEVAPTPMKCGTHSYSNQLLSLSYIQIIHILSMYSNRRTNLFHMKLSHQQLFCI